MIEPVEWVVAFVAGMTFGQFLKFERVRSPDGATRLRPRMDRRPFDERRWVTAVLVLLFVAGTAQLTYFSYHQRQIDEHQHGCNVSFQTSIKDRSSTSADDNALSIDNDNAALDFLTGLLQIPVDAPDARDRTRALLRGYADRIISNNNKRNDNAKYRAAHPIPDPQC